MSRRLVCRPLVLTATVLVTVAMGCSSSGSRAATPTSTSATTPTQKAFDALPRYPRSAPSGPAQHVDGATVQTFGVFGDAGQEIVSWYATHLGARYTVVHPPRQTGRRAYQGEWESGDRRLVVSTAPSPLDTTAAGATRTQYTLELSDPGVVGQSTTSTTTTTTAPSGG